MVSLHETPSSVLLRLCISCIFIHQSQKDSIPFQGTDDREFWQRAEERNASTAKLYAELGLTQYAAVEAFVRWHY